MLTEIDGQLADRCYVQPCCDSCVMATACRTRTGIIWQIGSVEACGVGRPFVAFYTRAFLMQNAICLFAATTVEEQQTDCTRGVQSRWPGKRGWRRFSKLLVERKCNECGLILPLFPAIGHYWNGNSHLNLRRVIEFPVIIPRLGSSSAATCSHRASRCACFSIFVCRKGDRKTQFEHRGVKSHLSS